ncbi:MAG: hypothetical protein ACRD41_15995, partial [Candidatus Acidiferrales bacterium]
MRTLSRCLLLLALGAAALPSLFAWDEPGHRLIANLAVTALPADFPAWVKTPENFARLGYLAAEPDRWRGLNAPVLNHINSPDHYFDVEALYQYHLKLADLPRFRNEFIEELAVYRAEHPRDFHYNPAKDRDHTREIPGLLPYAMEELRLKIASEWSVLRTYEKYSDVVTPREMTFARECIIHDMGILAHFAGDSTQPLHATIQHHGWVGPNPEHFTTDPRFHEYIDGKILILDHIDFADLKSRARPPEDFNPADDWAQILAAIGATQAKVVPLYTLQRDGELEKPAGKL